MKKPESRAIDILKDEYKLVECKLKCCKKNYNDLLRRVNAVDDSIVEYISIMIEIKDAIKKLRKEE